MFLTEKRHSGGPLLNLEQIQKMSESDTWTNGKGQTIRVNEAKTPNVKAIQRNVWENKEVRHMREAFRRKFGFDFADTKKFPVAEAGFSWNKVCQKLGLGPSVQAAMSEADSATTFVQVLRAGIQQMVNNSYQTVPTTFESWVSTVNSNKDTELYAPLHGIAFLSEVGKQELYPESRAAGLDIKLINRKYGTQFAVERELLEDDQTGQFAKQAGLLGEYAKLAIEAIVYAKLAGVGGTYSTLTIPATETKPSYESSYPFSSTGLRGGGKNRPSSFGILTLANIQAGNIGLMNMVNLLGLKMNVDPRRLIVSPQDRFNAAVLLNSSFYPAGAQAAGVTGGAFAVNPIESIAALTVTRFMFKNDGTVDGTSRAWYYMDDSKPFFVAQLRTAAEVTQEAPNAGESFNRDIIRYKLTLRCNADYIDPRFVWQGNDGSVTS